MQLHIAFSSLFWFNKTIQTSFCCTPSISWSKQLVKVKIMQLKSQILVWWRPNFLCGFWPLVINAAQNLSSLRNLHWCLGVLYWLLIFRDRCTTWRAAWNTQSQERVESLVYLSQPVPVGLAAADSIWHKHVRPLSSVNMIQRFLVVKDPGHTQKQTILPSDRAERHGKANVWYFLLYITAFLIVKDAQWDTSPSFFIKVFIFWFKIFIFDWIFHFWFRIFIFDSTFSFLIIHFQFDLHLLFKTALISWNTFFTLKHL